MAGPSTMVFQDGAKAEELFIILRGFGGRRRQTSVVGWGCFDEVCLLDMGRRSRVYWKTIEGLEEFC